MRFRAKFFVFSLLFVLCVVPGVDAREQRYVFFLHNMFLETAGLEDAHPEYGKAEYREIVAAFEKEGFTVISEIRKRGTDGVVYAQKIKGQIDSLLGKGVKANAISVVGTSKGAYIAWHVAALVKKRQMNYVLIGICNETTLADNRSIEPCGNILSIYEKSDVLGQTCISLKSSSSCIAAFKEIELHTGKKHGFLYKADPLWLKPAINWAKGNYELK